MMRSPLHYALALVVAVSAAAVGCGGKGAETPENAGPDIHSVNASVVMKDCPDSGKGMNSKAANTAIRKLVAPCSKVPGGAAHFQATLMPGGRIQLASPDGDPTQGVVPTCVLENQLNHGVALKKPCKLDVFLEEGKVGAAAEPAAEDQEK
ncbi:hypothetical protein [Polyangium aurulentum]|uniref:hypothetical protein n=1 Tax=Polyangium aurulentum TaxID=2567896 RepID=UPI0010AE6113|nr:hypothetical protein [Polyangium aurulentum]UQA56647.1 hypothetical protein E8A73_035870 [Polyangium aurulentum]